MSFLFGYYPTAYEMEKAVRENFRISGWAAVRQLEYANKGHIILVTQEKNIEIAQDAGVRGVATMDEALAIAYDKFGSNSPKFTIMPQGANIFPILIKGALAAISTLREDMNPNKED